MFHSQLNFDATADASILKLSGTNCSCRLSSCLSHLGECRRQEAHRKEN